MEHLVTLANQSPIVTIVIACVAGGIIKTVLHYTLILLRGWPTPAPVTNNNTECDCD